MAILRATLRSDVLEMDVGVNFIIPYDQLKPNHRPARENTLILLHGLKQNADCWPRMSRVEQFAHELGVNVITPEVQRSWYANQPYGLRYFDFINDELPRIASGLFHIPVDPDHLYVGGLSMGGFGALKCALTYPERYAGAIALSGALRFLEGIREFPEALLNRDEMRATLGMDLKAGAKNDLIGLAKAAADAPHKPRLYIACGYGDFLIEQNRQVKDALRQLPFDLTYEEWSGEHNWTFWDRGLGRGMAWMYHRDRTLFEGGMDEPAQG